jgi:hypothetical protein
MDMAKRNQRIIQAFERVNRGTPASNPYEVKNDGHSIKLFHYGTKILEVDAVTFFVLDYNPVSLTSTQAINTALEHLGVPRRVKSGQLVKI